MMRTNRSRLALPLVLMALAGCAARAPVTTDAARRSNARPAALARLTIENRTAHALTIAFRPAASGGAEVVIGEVAAGADVEVAPIPAGEPIVLLARTQRGGVLRLPPRSFELDGSWRWVIPADAVFREPDTER